jgi:hypothetical protein
MLDVLKAWLHEYRDELRRWDGVGDCVHLRMRLGWRNRKRYHEAEASLLAALIQDRDGLTVPTFDDSILEVGGANWARVPNTEYSWVVPADANIEIMFKGLSYMGNWTVHHFRTHAFLKPWSLTRDRSARAICESMAIHGIDVVVDPFYDNEEFDVYILDAEIARSAEDIQKPPPGVLNWLRKWLGFRLPR